MIKVKPPPHRLLGNRLVGGLWGSHNSQYTTYIKENIPRNKFLEIFSPINKVPSYHFVATGHRVFDY